MLKTWMTTIKKCPDAAYRSEGANYPSVVIEIFYSQTQKNLADIAKNYIIGTGSNIGIVIDFDLDYKNTRQASVLCWRPFKEIEDGEEIGICKQVMDEVFNFPSSYQISSGI